MTVLCYALGALLGLLVARGGVPSLLRVWPLALRTQLLLTASVLGLFAAWRLSAPGELLAPLVIEVSSVVALLVALATRKRASMGQASLESWAAGANGGFWVTPVAGALAGPSAITIAVIADRLGALRTAFLIHFLRRDAPLKQSRRTSLVDQSPLLALAVGLILNLVAPAPVWSGTVLSLAGPVLAFTGAALFVGSVWHPDHRSAPPADGGLRRWLLLLLARAVVLLPFALLQGGALGVVAVLWLLSAPAFNPPQLAVLYGYRSGVVHVAARYGWLLAPLGLALALLVR